MKYLFCLIFFICQIQALSQKDSSSKISYNLYSEIYYSYTPTKPFNHEKEDFFYNHKRSNELNVNLVIAKANYSSKKIRSTIALMAGNYADYNLQSEPQPWAKFINEANIGIKLSQKKNIWLDAGILPSHIGFESAISADCYTLTRSLVAENSPYYESGIKLSYTSNNEKWFLSLLLLNGWQKIFKPDYIQTPSFGMQVSYKPSEEIFLNYSNFIGTDKPDSLKALRFFHNFYFTYKPNKQTSLIFGFDIGSDKYNNTNYANWFSPISIIQYKLNSRLLTAFRCEYYNDKKNIIVATNNQLPFKVLGLSSNIDFVITENCLLRAEYKMYNATEKNFQHNSNKNYSLTSSISFKL